MEAHPSPEHKAPTGLCSLIQGPQQAVQRGQQAVQLLLPVLCVLQTLGKAST